MDATLVSAYHNKLLKLIKDREAHFMFAVNEANGMSSNPYEQLAFSTAIEETNNEIQDVLDESFKDLYVFLENVHIIRTARQAWANAAGNQAKQAKQKKRIDDAKAVLKERFG